MAPTEHDRPFVDTQALTDLDPHVYEAIATLELGRDHQRTRDGGVR
jgi:hypothetical protein